MKKAFTISFLLLYLILNVGVNILVHTCGGEAETFVTTTSIEDPCVCSDDMPMDEMCCTTTITTVKLDDAQKTTVSVQPNSIGAVEYLPSTSFLLFNIQHSSFVIPGNTSPPVLKDFQASNSVFLI